ncbi:MAG TPA: thermonuclease family protein [Rubrivivax sp.]|nr:thermonuclease family protein [Rubrivivax sp.]
MEGTVARVVDGDTLWLTPPGKAPLVVRLRDIDAPEICQPWGLQARQALVDLTLNRRATLRKVARDTHGRTVGSIIVDGVDVGPLMVAEGHAWSTRTRYDRGPLVKQERMAKALGRGLHGAGGAVMPRDFRQAQGACPLPNR